MSAFCVEAVFAQVLATACFWFALLLVMAGQYKRIPSLKDESIYDELIKLHLEDPEQCTLHWNTLDFDVVAAHYQKFLCGVASHGCSIHVAIFTKRLADFFKGSSSCKKFAQKMGDVLSYCRAKTKGCKRMSGARQSKAVLAIMDAIKAAKAGGDADVASSSDVEFVEAAPSTPPKPTEDGALKALKKLQEVWGDVDPPVSATACSSSSKDFYVPDSPLSVVSSVAASPVHEPPSAASVYAPEKPVQVQRFIYYGSPADPVRWGGGLCAHSCPSDS